ncbi:DsbA family protein [Hyphomicrobium sp.]|uniref:DsbA family protein n=1 Tax=Hyphomicrobium sp. TaxID=82 RepID=UPI002E2F6873|nr:DsbA family protein [Hyphomicrobium sp.]HEX2841903.1 DsbA family protein [Hyphomicrobium sp.]
MTESDRTKTSRPSALSIAALVAAPLLLLAGLWFVLGSNAQDSNRSAGPMALIGANATHFTPDQRQAIEGIIKDYLVQNPEIFLEVQSALEIKMAKDEVERTKALVAEHAKEIYRAPNAPVAGNPDGDITVVEFFDYNCGYCKRGFSEVAKLVEQDKNVRVVFKEFPILRDESEQAAKVALAARMQGKYWEVHRDLIQSKGLVNEAVALKVAEAHGLDMAKLKADMASPEVKGELDRVKQLASKLQINGTPHFLVGDRAIGGAPENLYDVLEGHVTELRKSGCAYC